MTLWHFVIVVSVAAVVLFLIYYGDRLLGWVGECIRSFTDHWKLFLFAACFAGCVSSQVRVQPAANEAQQLVPSPAPIPIPGAQPWRTSILSDLTANPTNASILIE